MLRCLRVPRERLISQHLVKRSIDARRRDRIRVIYSVDVNVRGEKAPLRRRASTVASDRRRTSAIALWPALHRSGREDPRVLW